MNDVGDQYKYLMRMAQDKKTLLEADQSLADAFKLKNLDSIADQFKASTSVMDVFKQQDIAHQLKLDSIADQFKASTSVMDVFKQQDIAHQLKLSSIADQFKASTSVMDVFTQQDIAHQLKLSSIADQFKASTSVMDVFTQQDRVFRKSIGSMMDHFKTSTATLSALGQQGISNQLSVESIANRIKASTSAISSLGQQTMAHRTDIGAIMEQFKVSTAAISSLWQHDVPNGLTVGSIMEQFNALNLATTALGSRSISASIMGPEWLNVLRSASDLSASRSSLTVSSDRRRVEIPLAENALVLNNADATRQFADANASRQPPVALDATAIVHLVENVVRAVLTSHDPEVKDVFWGRVYPLILFLLGLALAPVADHYIKLGLATLATPAQQSAPKQVKSAIIQSGLPRELFHGYRFVDSNYGVALRTTARMNAHKVGALPRGAVVQVIEVDGSWSLVNWASQQERSIVQGWIPSRYLKKFK